jgi:hypothetical protein
MACSLLLHALMVNTTCVGATARVCLPLSLSLFYTDSSTLLHGPLLHFYTSTRTYENKQTYLPQRDASDDDKDYGDDYDDGMDDLSE